MIPTINKDHNADHNLNHKTRGDLIMKRTMITLTALLIVGFMTASAFAWGQGEGKRKGCRGKNQAMYNSLTQEQKDQLQDLRQQFVDETYETRSAMMIKHQQLRMLMETSNPEKAELKALSDEVLDLKKAMADKRIDFALEAKKIAPELNLMAFGRHGGRMGKGGFGSGKCSNSPCPWNNDTQQTIQ